ncbi:MAG: ABC transporter transmembrane domain-containing protein [Pseudomonadota bacterium]|nr:ABC transporter transmembrane domain-containing protein [Pseudomonadota bacterium]
MALSAPSFASRDDAATSTGRRDLRPLRYLLRYVGRYRRQLALAAVALVVAAGTVLGLGQGLRLLVDRGFGGRDPALLDAALVVLLAVVLLLALASFLRFYMISWVGERVVADLRRDVYSHVLTLSPGFFETRRTGEVLSRLSTDTTLVQVVVGSSVSIALRNLLLLVGGLIMLLVTSAKLTGLVLLVVPIVVAPIVLLGRRVRALSRDSQDRVADVGVYVEETLTGIRAGQAFVHEAVDRQRFGVRVEDAFATAIRRVRTRGILTAIVIALIFGAIAVILWIGGRDVLAGRISAGELSSFVFYAAVVAGAVGALSEVVGDLQRAAGATERLFDLLATAPEIAAPAAPTALPAPPVGRIAFEQVRFFYPSRPDSPVLDDFTLVVEPGETVALVGPSGAGKTTVFQLLRRFYDPSDGRIRFDGVDLRAADPAAVRAAIGLVPQDPILFSDTAAENIRYGRPDADMAAVRVASEIANANDFIDQLPAGFDSHLGEKGVRLSGGQRQRVAIARAVLKDPTLLLLDEATSSLDAESERAVQAALEKVMEGRTTLVIAHRLATVLKADRIIVMDQGRVVASGTHTQLLRDNPLYARLAALQFAVAG